jgi:hypothetical protein
MNKNLPSCPTIFTIFTKRHFDILEQRIFLEKFTVKVKVKGKVVPALNELSTTP